MQWGSIGWSVPASFGYAMGLEPDRRLVSVIGDGSFQLTAQEVSNMIRHRQEILIFLVNNRGYVIESAIHDGPYNYYKNWDYAGLIDVFNAEDGGGLGLTATTASRTGRCDRQSPRPQGRAGPDRMPDPQRRRQPRAHLLGIESGSASIPGRTRGSKGRRAADARPHVASRPVVQTLGCALPAGGSPLGLSFAVDMPDVCCPLG